MIAWLRDLALTSCCFLGGHLVVLAAFLLLGALARRGTLNVRFDRSGARRLAEFVLAESLMLTAALHLGVVQLSAFSAPRTLAAMALGLLWWEAWFYAGHRAMHTRWLYTIHRAHHAEAGVHPSLCFSAAETVVLSSGFYVPLAFASHLFHAVSIVTLVAVFTAAYALNLVSHLDYDLFGARFEEGPLRHLVNSTRYHALHHAGRRGNYGLVTPWLDRLCGTDLTAR
jgi:Delta7-sterol 5-desaturase